MTSFINSPSLLPFQERFRSITKSYYRNSVGVVLSYDICNRDTFIHIPVWMQEAKRHIEPHKAVFVLVSSFFYVGPTTVSFMLDLPQCLLCIIGFFPWLHSVGMNNKHLNSRLLKSDIQIICYSDVWFLLLTRQENNGQIIHFSDHHLNNGLK